jgi:general secretion pathway protein A
MFLKFFGLKDNPFKLAVDAASFYMGRHHEEAMAHLRYAIAEGEGFTVITGERGVGKSTVCRAFAESAPRDLAVAFLSSPIASPKELLQRMNRRFGIPAAEQTAHELTEALNAFLMRQRVAGRKVAVFIDGAQSLAPDVLEQVRLISNLETTRDKLIQIVLIGEPELLQLLDSHELRQMGQRVSVCYTIGPLTLEESAAYIQHRLSIFSAGPPVRFPPEAVRPIFRYARGNPRRTNIACHSTLTAAFRSRQKEITGALAQAVVQELDRQNGVGAAAPAWRLRPAWALAAGGVLLLGAAAFWVLRPAPETAAPQPRDGAPSAALSAPVAETSPPADSPAESEPAPEGPAVAENPPPAPAEPKPAVSDEGSGPGAGMTHSVQVGAYQVSENARQMAARLAAKGYPARILTITDAKGRVWHTVRIGDHPSHQAARSQSEEFTRREKMPTVVRPFGAF